MLFWRTEKAGVTGRAEAERGGRALGVSVRDAGSKTGGDSERVGVEDADTKVSLDDMESPVRGLPSVLSLGEVGLDDSWPSELGARESLWMVCLFFGAGGLAAVGGKDDRAGKVGGLGLGTTLSLDSGGASVLCSLASLFPSFFDFGGSGLLFLSSRLVV